MSEEAAEVNDSTRHVIIGNGAAGNEAAWHLRQRDPDSRITVVTAGRLLFLNRYQFPRVLEGVTDWRKFLVHPPEYYDQQRITVRRNSWVERIDPERRLIELRHKESVSYDKLLVASGGGGYLPENLRDYRHLMHDFSTIRYALQIRDALPGSGGKVIMLGGDMRGLDLARTLIRDGHEVIVVAGEQFFWPHEVSVQERPDYVSVLERMGIQVISDRNVECIERGPNGIRARRLIFEDGGDLLADVVMPFYGLMPALNFMVGTGIDMARGLLVNPQLRTANEYIWAAGDVCQIWSPEENQYRFYYGWNNVKMMGRIAAVNMTGGNESVSTFKEDRLMISNQGELDSTLWEYD
jgi:NAD(P)H-nitrite reductase large subunit